MKRCPQCEFVYEDDQDYCDMDGKVLVYDSRPLQRLEIDSSRPGFSPKSKQRKFAAAAVASVVFGLGPIMTYYVLQRVPPQPISPSSSGTKATQPSQPQPTLTQPSATTTDSVTSFGNTGTETESKRNLIDPKEGVGQTGNSSSHTPSEQKAKPITPRVSRIRESRKGKPDSKVRSILKKTGRLIKKPFHF
jgi:hypothetical protein